MNYKSMLKSINDTCATLNSLGLLFAHKSAAFKHVDGYDRVTWAGPDDPKTNRFGSLEQYLGWVSEGAFTCLLYDLSLIRASYSCVDNEVVAHNLLYWPCPVDFKSRPDDLSDVCDVFEICLNSPRDASIVCDLTMRTPMRFDFDPDREGKDHPLVHLHMQFEETRIDVQEPMQFPSFIKKVYSTFYPDVWAKHAGLRELHEQDIRHVEAKYERQRDSLQVAWR